MKISIRFKFFAVFGSLIIFYVMLSWLLNSQFLDKYYFYNKKHMLMESYSFINGLYKGDPNEVSLEIEKLERMKGMNIIIADKNFDVIYSSMSRLRDERPYVPGRNARIDNQNQIEPWIKQRVMDLTYGESIIVNRKDARLNSDFLSLLSIMDTGDYIFIGTPVAAIDESVQIANKFLLLTGLITIITGCIIVIFITGKLTRPILELNGIAQKMSGLDFSKRYTSTSKDELGQLGESINSLSEQLEKSIFELKSANESLKEDIEKERKIDEMRKEFISNVSHELKTPIALIQGYSEGLKVNVNEDEENKNFYCDVITDEAQKMNRLVKQLLDLSQLESGFTNLDIMDFDLTALVERVLKKNELIFREKGIEVIIEKKNNLIVNADIYRIEQVLMNYINNAINYADNKNCVRISLTREDNLARVTVFNSGHHIPKEDFDNIWLSFYKADKARSRMYGGTGLGLSIVKAIQEAHHMGYGLNNVECGVEFWFELAISDNNDNVSC